MNDSRLQYLRALGLEVWERRGAGVPVRSQPTQVNEVRAVEAPIANAALSAKSDHIPDGDGSLPTQEDAWRSGSETEKSMQLRKIDLDWPELEVAVKGCTLCTLSQTRTQTVFGVGDKRAQWMVIGEAPGADEDAQGEPFVGRAGQLLNSMLKACGLRREEVFIANILKCRPPQNRDPTPVEAACCTPYLYRQIELVNPRIILCVGRIAAQNLLSTDIPIGKLRGKVHRLGAQQRPVVVTYHPAYLLRSPGEKRRAWEDLQLAMKTRDEASV